MHAFEDLEIRLLFELWSDLRLAISIGISQIAAGVLAYGLLASFSVDSERHPLWRGIFGIFLLIGVFVGPRAAAWVPFVIDTLEESHRWAPNVFSQGLELPWLGWLGGGGLGALIWWLTFHRLIDGLNHLREKLSRRTSVARQGRTDIRTIANLLPKPGRAFDPSRYFKPGKIFVGLNRYRRPIYIAYELFCRCHIQLVGTTGSGKGRLAGVLMAQALLADEAVIVVNPKDDEWAPHLCRQVAENAGKMFVLFDLRLEAPQFNLIEGASPEQVEELLVAGLGLSDRGDAADHYRVKDRRAARAVAQQVMTGNPSATLVDLLEAAHSIESIQQEAEGFVGRLSEIAHPSICARNGHRLAQLIEIGACIYFIGSMRHGRILAMQRMLLVRLCQLAESRPRVYDVPRKIMIFLDELKAHISKPALEMLGAIRDKGAHLILAHQSLGDLRDCPSDLNPDAVVDAIIENCKLRFAYKVQNADTAEWLARTTGKILVDDESRRVERAVALVETTTGERTIRQAERALVDENMLFGLPEGVAVFFGPSGVDFAHICPFPVRKTDLSPSVFPDDQEPRSPGSATRQHFSTSEILPNVDL